MATTTKKKKDTYTLYVAKPDSAPVLFYSSSLELELQNQINSVAKALSVLGFKGCAVFTILKNNVRNWTAVVTFTDDGIAPVWIKTEG